MAGVAGERLGGGIDELISFFGKDERGGRCFLNQVTQCRIAAPYQARFLNGRKFPARAARRDFLSGRCPSDRSGSGKIRVSGFPCAWQVCSDWPGPCRDPSIAGLLSQTCKDASHSFTLPYGKLQEKIQRCSNERAPAYAKNGAVFSTFNFERLERTFSVPAPMGASWRRRSVSSRHSSHRECAAIAPAGQLRWFSLGWVDDLGLSSCSSWTDRRRLMRLAVAHRACGTCSSH